MSPWLIVTAGWPAAPRIAANLLSRTAAHPETCWVVTSVALALGTGVLIALRSRERQGPRSTSCGTRWSRSAARSPSVARCCADSGSAPRRLASRRSSERSKGV